MPHDKGNNEFGYVTEGPQLAYPHVLHPGSSMSIDKPEVISFYNNKKFTSKSISHRYQTFMAVVGN